LVIDFVPIALSADTVDWVEVGSAAALSIVEFFVDSASNNAETCTLQSVSRWASARVGEYVIGGVALTLSAGSVYEVEFGGTSALSGNDVIDSIGVTGDTADAEVGIEEGVDGALLADTGDLVES
jgi:hypothetical protein